MNPRSFSILDAPAYAPGSTGWGMRRLLGILLAVALAVAVLVFAPVERAHAAINGYTPLTWNMAGARNSQQSKWTNAGALSAGRPGSRPHSVIAIQEAGPQTSLPSNAQRLPDMTVTVGGVTYTIAQYRWRVGSSSRGIDVYLYWMNTDPGGNRVNLAMVSHTQAQAVHVVPPQPYANGSGSGRPAFGIQLDNMTTYWNVHARAANTRNDANNLLTAIAAAPGTAQWAVLGDFNRDPSTLTLPPGAVIIRAGAGGTQQSGGELDYMVASQAQALWRGNRLTDAVSDHLPVEFGYRFGAAAGDFPVNLGDNSGECMAAQANSFAQIKPCAADASQSWEFKGRRLGLFGSSMCLDLENGSTQNNTRVVVNSCNSGTTQQWEFTTAGQLVNFVSNRCMDSRPGHSWMVISDCEEDDFLAQQFILPWAGMAVNANDLCIDDRNGSTANSNPVQSADCGSDGTTAPSQLWARGSDYSIVFKGKCLDIQGNATANGSRVILYDCSGAENQKWHPQPNGTVLNPQSGRCLIDDPYYTTEFRQLAIYDCSVVPLPPGSWWAFPF